MGRSYKILGTTANNPNGAGSRSWIHDTNSNISTLTATDYKQPKQILQIGQLDIDSCYRPTKTIYSTEGISPTLTSMQGGNTQAKVLSPVGIKVKYTETTVGDRISYTNSTTKSERVGKQISNAVLSSSQLATLTSNFSIRKLTPLECWRLMGFSDEDFYKAQQIKTSDTQLYKQAGNSIVVNVIREIFKQLLLH